MGLLSYIILALAVGLPQPSFSKESADKPKSLNAAALVGDKKAMVILLKDNLLDLNSQDEAGMTPLMSAALGGQKEIVKMLLAKKVKLEIKNKAGDTALAVAITNDHFEVGRILVHAGANVDLNVSGEREDTLFMRAALSDSKTAALILRKNKSVLNKTNNRGENALMQAVRFGNIDSIKMLLKQGAETKAKNKAGQTALDIARDSRSEEAIRLLSQ